MRAQDGKFNKELQLVDETARTLLQQLLEALAHLTHRVKNAT
jgi:hypothetical protein